MKTKYFFDSVSDFFDDMTNASIVISRRKVLLKNLIPENSKTAVDLGCGTGADSISLGLNNLDVTGFDISEKMIEKAKINSRKFNLNSKFLNYSLDKIPGKFDNKFDVAVSLGNSLALVVEKKLCKTIKRIYTILKPKGVFIFQILNYTAIKKENNRIVNISQTTQNVYVRFYDLFEMPLNFNILKFDKSNPKDFELLTTKLFPYDKEILVSVLKKTGFKRIKAYSSLKRDNFYKNSSKDLVVVAYKI